MATSGQKYFRLEKLKVVASQLVDEITSGGLFQRFLVGQEK